MERTVQKNNITPRQQEIINRFNFLNYCKVINNLNLSNLKAYSSDDKTNLLISGVTKLMSGEQAQKEGYRYTVRINKPLEEIKPKLLTNDPEILSKVLEKIRIHNFKYNLDCDLGNIDYDKQIIGLIDEFNQISVCESFNNFKLSDLGISKVTSQPTQSMAQLFINKWPGGSVSFTNLYNMRVPFDFDETKERVQNNDEVLYRMIRIKLDKFLDKLPFGCGGNVDKPVVGDDISSVPMDGPVDNERITHTGPKNTSINYKLTPKDSINENIQRIKQVMGLNESDYDVDNTDYEVGLSDDDRKINKVRSRLISVYDSYLNKIHALKVRNKQWTGIQLWHRDVLNKRDEINSTISQLEQKLDDIRNLMKDKEALLSLYDNNHSSDMEHTPQDEPSYDIEFNPDQAKSDLEAMRKKSNDEFEARVAAYISSPQYHDDLNSINNSTYVPYDERKKRI